MVTNSKSKSEILSAQADWTSNTSSQKLESSKQYYFKILHFVSIGTMHLKLGWKKPWDKDN
jgi:hypothetical protein